MIRYYTANLVMAEETNEDVVVRGATSDADVADDKNNGSNEHNVGSSHNGEETSVSNKHTLRDSDSDDDRILFEAALEYTALEKSPKTANKLKCISITVFIMGAILFVFSFPFSLFLILFCFDTKRSCSPFQAICDSPWKLYLTRNALHYHLPNPPHRPYVNLFYCMKRAYEYTIPLKDIKNLAVESNSIDVQSQHGPIDPPKLENIIIDLKSTSLGVKVPVYDYMGVWSKCKTVHTLIIYSVKDATTFVDTVKEHMR